MLKTPLFIVLSALPGFAQTVVPIKVKAGAIERTWNITLKEKTVLSGIGCDATEMEPGDSTVCHVFTNQKTSAPFSVQVTIPAGFTGPATVTIPAGAIEASFTITRGGGVARLPILPSGISVWAANRPAAHFVDVSPPCCARDCGIPADQVALEPCRTVRN